MKTALRPCIPGFLCFFLLALPPLPYASESEDSLSSCLRAWGQHPFGTDPAYRTLGTTFNIFGVGTDLKDPYPSDTADLVLVRPSLNIMGGTTVELLNPNGWYCLQGDVTVMGRLTIQADCQARLAFAGEGLSVLAGGSPKQAITVLGATRIERVGCGEMARTQALNDLREVSCGKPTAAHVHHR